MAPVPVLDTPVLDIRRLRVAAIETTELEDCHLVMHSLFMAPVVRCSLAADCVCSRVSVRNSPGQKVNIRDYNVRNGIYENM